MISRLWSRKEIKVVWPSKGLWVLAKTILKSTVKGKKRRVRQMNRCDDNIKESTEILPAQLGRLKTGQGRKGLLRSH